MRSQLLRFGLLSACLLSLFEPCSAAEPAAPVQHIVARQRQFIPPVTVLTTGEPVTLIIKNEDEELHAFVPLLLFQGINVQVTGNGAPEFNDTGFVRVLIPPDGQAELRFRPSAAGHFFYICDLPGHQMRGEIIVTDSP